MRISNPFKEIIFTNRTWMQLSFSLVLIIIDLVLLVNAYKYIKIYIYYSRSLKKIAINEVGYARERLAVVTGGFFPYANLLAASLELENNNPKNALDLLNKINYEKFDDRRMKGFAEILKSVAFVLLYEQEKKVEILAKVDTHLNNATMFCPDCIEVKLISAYLSLLNNKTVEAYNKLNDIISNTNSPIEKNVLYEATKYLGEIHLHQDKCEKAMEYFQNAYLYAPDNNQALLKYLYCYLKTYKLKGEKNEIENLRGLILKKTSYISHTFSLNDKYYYSLILLEIGNLHKKAGNIYRAYEMYMDSLKHACNFDAVLMYAQTLQEELTSGNLKPFERKIKSEELENLEERLATKLTATPLEASEFLNCIAINYYKMKGDINKAIALLEKAKSKSPKNEKVLANLAILYINSGQIVLAREIVDGADKQGIRSSLLEKIKGVIK